MFVGHCSNVANGRRQAFSETLADLPARRYVFEKLDDDSYLRDDFAIPPTVFGRAPFRRDKKKPWAEFYMGMLFLSTRHVIGGLSAILVDRLMCPHTHLHTHTHSLSLSLSLCVCMSVSHSLTHSVPFTHAYSRSFAHCLSLSICPLSVCLNEYTRLVPDPADAASCHWTLCNAVSSAGRVGATLFTVRALWALRFVCADLASLRPRLSRRAGVVGGAGPLAPVGVQRAGPGPEAVVPVPADADLLGQQFWQAHH